MKIDIRILIALFFLLLPYFTHNQTPNSDVVIELSKVSAKLKGVWLQKIKDSKIYGKMADYQKEMTTVFETAKFLKQTKSILELLDLIEAFACRVRMIHQLIGDATYNIPNSCGFDYNYQKAVTGFNMALDLSSLIMEDIQMSIGDRMAHLENSKELIIESEKSLSELGSDIINYNR